MRLSILAFCFLATFALTGCASNPPWCAPPASGQSGEGTASSGQNLAGFRFDPRGADFTRWVNNFKNQVLNNWIAPQAAYLGCEGRVDLEFTVERDGSISALRMLNSSGTDSLDRAARSSLTNSRFMPLPDDYDEPNATMRVTFHYGLNREK